MFIRQKKFVAIALTAGCLVASNFARADDIRVISSGGFAAAYKSLAPQYEKQSGNKLLTGWGPSMGTTTNAVPMRLARGETLDVVIMVGAALDQLMKEGKLLAGSKVKFADSLIACAVSKTSTPRPDISTVPALKQAFLNAKFIAVSDSASGEYIKHELLQKLGIETEVRPKIKQIPATPVGESVAKGDADMGCQQYSELLPIAGISILGNIPDEVQLVTEFSGAIVATSTNIKQGQALLQFLGSPQNAEAIAVTGLKPTAKQQSSLSIKDMGSFHVGGREVTLSGLPIKEVVFSAGGVPAKIDPNGVYQVEQMYVQYFVPSVEKGKLPLLMWHGGGLTGVTYETKPDGGEGWLNYFIKQGWTVYNSDAVERGRSGWAMYPEVTKTAPVFLTKEGPFERFRIGAGAGSYNKDITKMKPLPGNQFPLEGYDNFTKQGVPRWTSTDASIITAYTALVDKVCPCIVLAHSQGGPFAYQVAQARPDKVKALVLIEPAGIGDAKNPAALKNTPSVSIYGDFIEGDSRWPTIRANNMKFQAAIRDAGGSPELINLPAIGIKGNSHMMMMDKNSGDIAAVIQKWLESKGFTK